MLPMILPATSAEFNHSGMFAFQSFAYAVQAKELRACMASRGYPKDALAVIKDVNEPVRFQDNTDYPDIDMLKSGVFGPPGTQMTAGHDPAGSFAGNDSLPASQQKAWDADLSKCSVESARPFASVTKATLQLQGTFFRLVDQRADDPAIVAATSAWRECMATGGVAVSTPTELFAKGDAIGSSKGDPNGDPQVQALARLYGRCVEPLAKVRDELRLKVRAQMLDEHAAEVTKVEDEMQRLVSEYSAKYGVKLPAAG